MAFLMFRNLSNNAVQSRVQQFQSELSDLEISVAGRFARGNVALQSECVLTASDLEVEREQLRAKLLAVRD